MAEGHRNNSGDLMSHGKLVAEAAVSVFQQKSADNVDKKEVAGAAAELLDAASTYGKLDDKPVGQYLEKAEGYLKEFSAEKEIKAEAPPPAGDAPKSEEPPKEAAPAPAPAAEEAKSSDGFGIDDVVKGAESFVEKQGGGEQSAGGGLFKMAQGFMK